jgi:RNA polymerase sigma-70 factor (ECF subfamily)
VYVPEGAAVTLAPTIDHARRGDASALNRLLSRIRDTLRQRAAAALECDLMRRLDASDVVQQTLVEVAGGVQQFRGTSEGELWAWIQRILQRNLGNMYRSERAQKRDTRREVSIPADGARASIHWVEPADDGGTPSTCAIRGELAVRLSNALAELPSEQATAVRLRHLEGQQFKDIAQQMDCSIGAVAGFVRRGLAALRKKLTRRECGETSLPDLAAV